ncbi:S-adenosyl-L-methionine-dependent methyltransferase [Zychaea mexicana]|uniref:S-adenosyl-L-methionine-dependent methyltransferase n=1 Tax=Zychaea mexicana TaxID=64656 RepID=UPI0022FE2B26|nr:S-adenosyl-L-methionine-dependent methyltransferase [Zychaea mexicana]KAI9490784.1 S-adenosyl-L-methionine-dependent methyltransferase [Zychaea mexicana]
MGVAQSKRKTRLSEDVTFRKNHRSMFAEKASTTSSSSSRRSHQNTLPRSSAKSAIHQHSSGDASLMVHPRSALSSISLPQEQQQQQQRQQQQQQQQHNYYHQQGGGELESRHHTYQAQHHQPQKDSDLGKNYVGLEFSSRFLPDDWDSQDRGLTLHFALKRIFGGNVLPPVLSWFSSNARVVDIGCVNGAWLMDMAVQFPKCQFFGIETALSPTTVIPQVLSMHNVRFESVDWEARRIPLPDASVDICHMRAQSLNFEQRRWLDLLSEAYRILKPGGVVQITDFHYAMTGTVLIESFIDTVRNILNTVDTDIDIALKLDMMLRGAGFQVIESKRTKVNFASHGQLGEDFMAATLNAFEEAQELLAPKMGLDEDEYRQRVEMICAQCVQQDTHINWYAVVGRKPISS